MASLRPFLCSLTCFLASLVRIKEWRNKKRPAVGGTLMEDYSSLAFSRANAAWNSGVSLMFAKSGSLITSLNSGIVL